MPGYLNAQAFFEQYELAELCTKRGIPMPTPGAGRNPFGWFRSRCHLCQRRDWNWKGIRRDFPDPDRLNHLTYRVLHGTGEVFYCRNCRITPELQEAVRD